MGNHRNPLAPEQPFHPFVVQRPPALRHKHGRTRAIAQPPRILQNCHRPVRQRNPVLAHAVHVGPPEPTTRPPRGRSRSTSPAGPRCASAQSRVWPLRREWVHRRSDASPPAERHPNGPASGSLAPIRRPRPMKRAQRCSDRFRACGHGLRSLDPSARSGLLDVAVEPVAVAVPSRWSRAHDDGREPVVRRLSRGTEYRAIIHSLTQSGNTRNYKKRPDTMRDELIPTKHTLLEPPRELLARSGTVGVWPKCLLRRSVRPAGSPRLPVTMRAASEKRLLRCRFHPNGMPCRAIDEQVATADRRGWNPEPTLFSVP